MKSTFTIVFFSKIEDKIIPSSIPKTPIVKIKFFFEIMWRFSESNAYFAIVMLTTAAKINNNSYFNPFRKSVEVSVLCAKKYSEYIIMM